MLNTCNDAFSNFDLPLVQPWAVPYLREVVGKFPDKFLVYRTVRKKHSCHRELILTAPEYLR